MDLIKTNIGYQTVREEEVNDSNNVSQLVTYYEGGKVLCDQTFEQIRELTNGN